MWILDFHLRNVRRTSLIQTKIVIVARVSHQIDGHTDEVHIPSLRSALSRVRILRRRRVLTTNDPSLWRCIAIDSFLIELCVNRTSSTSLPGLSDVSRKKACLTIIKNTYPPGLIFRHVIPSTKLNRPAPLMVIPTTSNIFRNKN